MSPAALLLAHPSPLLAGQNHAGERGDQCTGLSTSSGKAQLCPCSAKDKFGHM